MNRVVRHAIEQGLKPITAIQMATVNTAQHFGMEREIGAIAPGRLRRFSDRCPTCRAMTHRPGLRLMAELVAEEGRLVADVPAYAYPATRQEHREVSARTLAAADFDIEAHRREPTPSAPA